VIPWIIFAVVVVPLVVVAFVVSRRKTHAGEAAGTPQTPESRARAEDEFAEAEAYEAEWHKADTERFQRERLP
jgi:hypothetical protein